MSPPWMPFYIADYRRDTGHLSAAEHGAYLLLIMHYWATGGLPDDDRQLARIACMSPPEWKRTRPVVGLFFRDGWKHKRIDDEMVKVAKVSDAYASRARHAANTRWGRQSIDDAPSSATSTQQECLGMPTSHSPSQEESKIKKLNGEAKREAASPPKHGATSPRSGRVYLKKGTSEWDAYAEDYRKTKGVEPKENPHGGRWFKIRGEAAAEVFRSQ